MNNTVTNEIDRLREDIVFQATLCGFDFEFHSTWGIFSPRAIDEGTSLLLKHLQINDDDRCLDVGCGYGALGLAMARLAPQGRVSLIDKDFVAVDYAKKNAGINQIANVDIFLSNGFSEIPRADRFDVIVSNLPAKAGKELFYLYFYDALLRMNPGARFYVVTVNGLRMFVKRVFNDVFGNYTKVKQGKNYTVSLARKMD
ncbi:MAG TPA: methyltransferase [Gammaproteobacteria bacterium]|nr:methyltransferase [Gammaproteobacteria bacterium]